MEGERMHRPPYFCPMSRFFEAFGKLKDRRSPFWEHLTKAKIELLEALKSLIEERIQDLKGKTEGLKKIKVE